MAKLQEERFERIALLVDQARRPRSPVGRDKAHRERVYSAWHRSLRQTFPTDKVKSLGRGWSRDAYALENLVGTGQVSVEDAEAYMETRFPSQVWASDHFREFLVDARDRALVDVSARPSADPTAIEGRGRLLEDIAAQGLQGRSDFVNPDDGVSPAASPLVPKLGPTYDEREVTRAIKSVTDQLAEAVAGVRGGNLQLPVNSVDGGSIRPGSITPDKVDQESFNKVVRDMPGPEDAVKLEVKRRTDLDQDAQATHTVGARRVWQVTRAVYPQDYKPIPGPQRFRVVDKGMKFNCMSLDGGPTTITVRYGMIIKDIPHFLGRVPDQILYATFTGFAPANAEGVHQNATSSVGPDSYDYQTSTRLFDSDGTSGRAHEDFISKAPNWLEAHGSNSNLAPSTTNVSNCEGVKFMLITGRTVKEVYAQLNSKVVNAAHLGGNMTGPTASIPPGRAVESPFPASASIQHHTAPLDEMSGVSRTNVTNTRRWRIGYPLSYDACSQLIATNTHFSLVVMPDLERQDDAMNGVSFDIDDMSYNGVTVVADNDREIGVDIVVV